MLISVGRFVLSVEGKAVSELSLPDSWQKYISAGQAPEGAVAIRLEENAFLRGNRFRDGWEVYDGSEGKSAVYSDHGKAVFSLRYNEPEKMTIVSVGGHGSGSLRLGLQYGMMLALHRECIGLHGVTLLCGNEVVILSAPSGTGKTTLAALLGKYGDAAAVNGDFALLSPTADGVIFEPTPFCGSSGRNLNHRLRVDRVVFLSQAKGNTWRGLNGREAIKEFMDNCFIPTWDREMQKAIQTNVVNCIGSVRVNAYAFAPTQEAADLFMRVTKTRE
ncbi:MAG: hypothetical protein IKI84_10095 [Clostridia bacterium]|nr:hypothetical protein [Clostridia bacterium]